MKKIISFIIGLVLLLNLVLAQPVPAPVTFKVNVNGYNINYDDTKITNTRTGEILTPKEVGSLRIINGIGFFDLQEFKLGYQPVNPIFNYAGDKIDVRICDVSSKCSFSFYIITRDPIQNTYKISITDETIPIEKYIEKIKCWDGSEILETQSCPKQPEVIVTKYVCQDGKEVTKSSDCIPPETEPDQTIIIAITVVILGLLFIWAWVKNTDLKGKYRWIPGMAGILSKLLEDYKKEKDKERSEKLKKTILKYSVTITEKYLEKIKK